MGCLLSKLNRVWFAGAAAIVLMSGCGHKLIVANRSTCTVSWDAVGDPRVSEYRVTTWPDVKGTTPNKTVYRVPVAETRASCSDVGARTAGPWLVSVEACTKKEFCSQAAGPVAFTIVDR